MRPVRPPHDSVSAGAGRCRRAAAIGLAAVALVLLPPPASAADTTPPYVVATWPPVNSSINVSGSQVTIGIRACDDQSPITLASTNASQYMLNWIITTNYVLAPVLDSPCRDILLVENASTRTDFSVTIYDAAGNSVWVGPFTARPAYPTVNFTDFEGSGPYPVLGFDASIFAEAWGALSVDLSTVEWSVIRSFNETPTWHNAGLAGNVSNATLTARLAIPSSGRAFVQWSAVLHGYSDRSYSRLYSTGADTDPPTVTAFDCGPPAPANDSVAITVAVADNWTGPNINGTRIRVSDAYGLSTNITPSSTTVESERRATANFSVPLYPGTNHLEVFAFDAVGNRNAVTACDLVRPDAPGGPPGPGGTAQATDTDSLGALVLIAVAVAAALAYLVLRASREGRHE